MELALEELLYIAYITAMETEKIDYSDTKEWQDIFLSTWEDIDEQPIKEDKP